MTENVAPRRTGERSSFLEVLRRVYRGEISPEEAAQILAPKTPPRDPEPPA
jgi:hypothetical protein